MAIKHKHVLLNIIVASLVLLSLCAVWASPLSTSAADGSSTDVQAPAVVGASVASAPAICGQNSSSLELFAKGTDNALWWRHWNGQTWSLSTSLGGVLTSDPAAVSRDTRTLDVFVRGGNGALWTRSTTDGGAHWGSWKSLGGGILTGTGPAASPRTGGYDVFVTGNNHALYQKTVTSSTGAWVNLGGYVTSSPGAASRSSSTTDVFVRGNNGSLYQRTYSNYRWASWVSLGGQIASGTGPAACSGFSAGRLDVFVKGMNNALYHRVYSGTWSSWENLGGVLTASPTAVAPLLASSTPRTTDFGSIPLNYTRYGSSPVISPPSATNELSELSVIKANGLISKPVDNYYLYTAPHNAPGGAYLYTAPAPTGPWTLYNQTPVLQNSILNDDSVDHVSSPWVVWNDETREFHCYFHAGYASGQQKTFLATSTDGVSWTLKKLTPALDVGGAGTWDSNFVYYPVVAKVGSNWNMWYEGCGTGSTVAIGLATSTDGINWVKYARNPVLSADSSIGEPITPGTMTGSAYYNTDDGGTFYLLYGLGGLGYRTTNIAKTSDGHTITRYTNNPILTPSANGWDSASTSGGVLFYDSGTYYLFYLGGSGTSISNIYLGLASSPPKVASATPNAHEVFVVVRGGDNGLWQTIYAPQYNQWSSWMSIGGI